MTETWLSPDTPIPILNSLTPPGYELLHSPRIDRRGGGLALIYRSSLNVSRIQLPSFTSFECLAARLTYASRSFILLVIYRPPNTSQHEFVSELSNLLDDLATSPSELLIAGDFNIHVDKPSASFSTIFLKLLDSFSLTQHINFSTHNSKHILDLFITRSSFTDILSIVSLDPAVSDHLAQLITINVPPHARRSRTTKLIRCFRKLDHKLFSQEILASPLCTIPPAILDSISVETYLHLFDHTLTSLLDKHVPLKSVTCPSREQKPYITPHIINEKRQRSKLETIYRRRKTTENLLNYKAQAQLVAKLITQGKRTYFKKLVTDCETQPKKLWSTLQTLLSRSTPPILPNFISSSNLAKRFITFFDQKIVKLCASISKVQLVTSTHQTKTSSTSTYSF